jgi:glycosyltransferase involved in cell wall biosynthesis
MTVVAIVPAHDEADRVGATVTAALSVAEIDRVLVIDDGSTDDTAARARSAGADVARLASNLGKGSALEAGLDQCADEADVVVFLDADLGQTAAEAGALIRPVLTDAADMTIAVLPRPAGSGGFGLVKALARGGIQRLAGFEAAAPLSGQRALSRAAVAAARPLERGFGVEVGLTVRVCRAGLRVLEVPTDMRHAATGRDLAGFVHRGRQFLAVAAALVRLAPRAGRP